MAQDNDQYLMDDEGAGYLISISDMMSGLLFVFIITLVAFIINFQDAIQRQETERKEYEKVAADLQIKNSQLEEERKKLKEEIIHQQKTREAYAKTVQTIVGAEAIRADLLHQIQQRLLAEGIQVRIDEDHGVLRLTEKAIRFDTGSAELADDQLEKLQVIGQTLAQILPCYADNPPVDWLENRKCEKKVKGKLNSVFVEGHTDNVPVSSGRWGRFKSNWELSALRAIYTYQQLIPTHLFLSGMVNPNGQPVFSVSGYGEGRPIPGHAHEGPTPDLENRRIDLRFIMTPPSETEAEKALKEAGIK